MTNIATTLAERHATHGSFDENADHAQWIKKKFRDTHYWFELHTVQREALELIATKISRILSGGYNHPDNWHDIAGYATLVEKWLAGEKL